MLTREEPHGLLTLEDDAWMYKEFSCTCATRIEHPDDTPGEKHERDNGI
jgi:hypothetical protein